MPSLSMHACTYVCSAQRDKQVTKNLWQPTGWAAEAKGYISFLKQYNTMAEYYTGVKKAACMYVYIYNNNDNDRLTAFDPGQPG